MENYSEHLERNIKELLFYTQPHLKMAEADKAIILENLLGQKNREFVLTGKRVAKNKITKIAIAAAVILVAFFAMPHWPGSMNGTGAAFAQVKEAIMKMPCVHIVIDGQRNQKDRQGQRWISFGSATKYEKLPDGTVSSVNVRTRKKSVYNPDSGRITVSYYKADDDSIEKMDSSDKLLSGLLDDFDAWDAKVTIERTQYQGIDVDVYSAQLPPEIDDDSDVKMTEMMKLIVDRSSHLPILAKLSGKTVDGTLLLDATLAFDYPENDIESIYALGVPESAEVIYNNATQPQLDIVLDRLSDRVEKGFGNSVAILTESTIKDGRDPEKKVHSTVWSER